MMKKRIIYILLLIFVQAEAFAQCSMCRAVLESEVDNSAAEGINNGIVYLMAFPYILVGGVLYFVYRSLKKKQSAES